jgi:hypothetical protein
VDIENTIQHLGNAIILVKYNSSDEFRDFAQKNPEKKKGLKNLRIV